MSEDTSRLHHRPLDYQSFENRFEREIERQNELHKYLVEQPILPMGLFVKF